MQSLKAWLSLGEQGRFSVDCLMLFFSAKLMLMYFMPGFNMGKSI